MGPVMIDTKPVKRMHNAMGQTSQKRTAEPWSIAERNRIVGAARTMPERVGEIEGRDWWPALILLILDLDISVEMAIRTPVAALNAATGRISCRHVLYQLHAKTLEALNTLPANRNMLLPWPKDKSNEPSHMLFRDCKTVLYRAGLRHRPEIQCPDAAWHVGSEWR